jgi:hypothetical protein
MEEVLLNKRTASCNRLELVRSILMLVRDVVASAPQKDPFASFFLFYRESV